MKAGGMRESKQEQIEAVAGAMLSLMPIGVSLVKGFAAGVSTAMVVEAGVEMYDFFTG